MVGRVLAIAAVLTLAAGGSKAAEVEISASVNRTTAGVGEEILLTVTISGGFQNLPTPELREMPDFSVYPSGSSTNFSLVNGHVTSSKTSRFVLVPKTEGKLTIPEIEVKYKGDAYVTKPIEITVTAAASPQKGAPQAPGGVSGGELLLKASVDKTKAYVSEQVTLTLRFYRRVMIVSSRLVPPPTTGFWVEELPGERNFYEVVDGLQYQVTEIARALFPTTGGVLEIGPAVWECGVRERRDPFGSDPFDLLRMARTRNASVRSEKLAVEVTPLPEAGKPRDFSGAVGRFAISASADKTALKAEEPLTFTVKVSGRGNIGAVGDIDMPEVSGFRSYDSGGSTDLSKDNRVVQGSKSFSRVYIPSVPGDYTIPPVKLVYFDPSEARYVTASSKEIHLSVSAGEGAAGNGSVAAAQGEMFAKDIRYIKTQTPSFTFAGDRLYRRVDFLMLQLLAPALIIGAYIFRAAREKAAGDPARARARAARVEAKRKLKEAGAMAGEGEGENAWKSIGAALRGYIGDITNTSPQGLTMEQAASSLRGLGVSDELIEEALAILERCDAAAFAPRGAGLQGPEEAARSTAAALDSIEGERANK